MADIAVITRASDTMVSMRVDPSSPPPGVAVGFARTTTLSTGLR
jgi:hypothetical protein